MTVHLLRLILQIVKFFFSEKWVVVYISVTSVTWLQARFLWKLNTGSVLYVSMEVLCFFSLCPTSHHCYSFWLLWVAQSRDSKDHHQLPMDASRGLTPKVRLLSDHRTGQNVPALSPDWESPSWDLLWNSRMSRKMAPGREHKAIWHRDVPNPKGFLGNTWRRLCWELWGAQYLPALSPGDKDSCLFPEMAV